MALRELALSAIYNCTAINKEWFLWGDIGIVIYAYSFVNNSCIRHAP